MALPRGTSLGPYEIVGLIGAGGMGEVYRARDPRLQRLVAIKVLPPSFATDPDRLRRFEHEARVCGSLNHPNIVAVFDVGADPVSPYLVTELLEGQTVRDKLVSRLPVERAVDYATQIATGLAAAHAKGILHRDLKPENVFVTRAGGVKILDFGLAKWTAAVEDGATVTGHQRDLSTPGTVLGTSGYMSPEQVLGKPVDARSDIFSFGSVLYEMLAGRRAFQHGSAVETMHAIVHEEPPDPSGLSSRVSPALLSILRRCLTKEADQRFQSSSDLAFALSALSHGHVAAAVLPGVTTARAGPRWFIGAIAGVVFAALCAAAGYWTAVSRPPVALPSYRQLTFRRGVVDAARFAPDGQTVIYAGRWDGKRRQLFSLRIDTAESTALALPEAGILSVSATGELAILKGDGTLARVPLGGGGVRDIADNVLAGDWAPDATNLALVRHDGARQWLEYPIGTIIFRPTDVFDTLESPRVSPDGELVAVLESTLGSAGHITVVDRRGTIRRRSRDLNLEPGVAWRPDGREVWFNGSETGLDFTVHAVALDGQERVVHRGMGTSGIADIARDGRSLMLHDRTRGEMTGAGPGEKSERDLSWLDFSRPQDLSPDGKAVLFTESGVGAGSNPAAFMRPTDGSPAVLLGAGLRARALSPDGKWALATRIDQSRMRMALLPTGAGQVRELETSSLTSFTYGRWLPDGTRVIFTARDSGHPPRDYVQSVNSGPPTPITPEGVSSRGGVTPDSRFVLAKGVDGPFSMMYPVNGGEPHPAKGFIAGDIPLRWTDDGAAMWTLNQGSDVPRILRINVTTGRREPWREINHPDPAGIDPATLSVVISADGSRYVFAYFRTLSDLYVAGGLR